MSWSLANEDGIIDQFATISGLRALREEARKESSLEDFIHEGATKNIAACIHDLKQVARETHDPNVKSTALGLAKLMKGQTLVSITNGADY